MASAPSAEVTASEGTLLGGNVTYRQLLSGYRTGLEPVLMAAFVPARSGQRVIEAGCGAGAGLLCLSQRMPDITGLGIERDPAMAQLAAANFACNQRSTIEVRQADFTDPALLASLRAEGQFHHALANPPWHPADATASPDARRDLARRALPETIPEWVRILAALLHARGSLTLALPAARLAQALAAFENNRIGSAEILPFWPKPGQDARIVLLRGRKFGRAGTKMLAGIVLHEADGRFSDAAQRILRDGCSL